MLTASARHSQAHHAWMQGLSKAKKGCWEDAARAYRKAHRLQPGDALYGLNLADALLKLNRPREALTAAEAAVSADPGQTLAKTLQIRILGQLNLHEQAVSCAASSGVEALDVDTLSVLGHAQMQLGKPAEAINYFLAGLVKAPTTAVMHYRLGLAFNALTMKAEASECFRTALLLGLGDLEAGVHDLLAFYEREICDWRDAGTYEDRVRERIAALSDDAAVEFNPFVHATLLDDPVALHRAACAVGRAIERVVTPLPSRPPVPRDRIRIGYVSADICNHATAYLIAQLVEQHDRSRFEVFLYSFGKVDDSTIRQRILSACEHTIDARDMTIPAMARRIREDGVDILVDLKGFTKDGRPALFAYRAAPVQVSYLGFPGTTGQACIDYIIGDAFVTPISHQPYYTERIAQLPGCYQCNDGVRTLPTTPSRAEVGLPDDALVLCGFNQPYKISPAVFDVWCRLLHRLPSAVLWLLGWNDAAPLALRSEAQRRGISHDRLIFAPAVPQSQHLDRIGCADLFLDTWPCNGHTTVSDMLWAGVPVVTWTGQTFASRVASSLLHAVGLPELACGSVADYEAKVIELAGDLQRLSALRRHIEAARRHTPLFDGVRMARDMEAIYERMWSGVLAGMPPSPLPAETPRIEPTALAQR